MLAATYRLLLALIQAGSHQRLPAGHHGDASCVNIMLAVSLT